MRSNQEMVDYGNECSRNQTFWVGIGALEGRSKFPVGLFGLTETIHCFGVYPLNYG